MADSSFLIVAALDFGTTYSGYAFSMRHEFKADPMKIHANPVWKAGSRQFMSLKAPTCLLLDKDKEFLAFGYDAENQYAEVLLDGEKDDHYYFHRFKMNLHNNKNITADMILEDVTGKPLTALQVFKLSIKFLVDHLLETLDKQGTGVKHNEVQWVLTVPAIWRDTAKQFMRSSAEQAGIPPDKLILALEPETASIFCQYLPVEKLKAEKSFIMSKQGTEYMVVDLGGGTADITVHRKAANGQLIEKHRATGNDCGGTSVDKRFFKILEDIVGESTLKSLRENDPLAYLDIEREFEAVKRTVETKKKGKVNMTIPVVSLDKVCRKDHNKDFQALVESSKYANEIKLLGDKMRMDADAMRNIFKPSIDKVISLLKEVLSNRQSKGISHFLMVGGFSECQLIHDAVKQEFPQKRIITPEDAGMCVLKGAVLFGHNPSYIKSRIMRFSYGVKTSLPFDERKFDRKHLVVMDGEERCDNIFSVIVFKDESVDAGTKIKRSYFTPYKHQDKMDFMIYISDDFNPAYVDDESCNLLCKPTITFTDTCEETRWVDVEYVFGNTEIGITAVDRNSGKEINATFNLIEPYQQT